MHVHKKYERSEFTAPATCFFPPTPVHFALTVGQAVETIEKIAHFFLYFAVSCARENKHKFTLSCSYRKKHRLPSRKRPLPPFDRGTPPGCHVQLCKNGPNSPPPGCLHLETKKGIKSVSSQNSRVQNGMRELCVNEHSSFVPFSSWSSSSTYPLLTFFLPIFGSVVFTSCGILQELRKFHLKEV